MFRDIAVIYSNGYGQIVGRIKDLVIRGGENLYPREIEEVLIHHPNIEGKSWYIVSKIVLNYCEKKLL